MFKRPKNISGDEVGDIPVLKHALLKAEKYFNEYFDIIIMLQPTAPLRKHYQIENVIKKIINEEYDTVWTIHKVVKQFHPDKQIKINSNGYLDYFTPNGRNIISRQQLDNTFMKNGIAYAMTRNTLLKKGVLLGKKSGFLILNGPIINIDTFADLKFAKNFL